MSGGEFRDPVTGKRELFKPGFEEFEGKKYFIYAHTSEGSDYLCDGQGHFAREKYTDREGKVVTQMRRLESECRDTEHKQTWSAEKTKPAETK